MINVTATATANKNSTATSIANACSKSNEDCCCKPNNNCNCPCPPPADGIICGPCGDSSQINKKTAIAYTLSCMDFRLRDNITCNLNLLGYKNNHDDFVLAGSSLGYNGLGDLYSSWASVADDHVVIAYNLHKISEIILVDHMDCAAYAKVYPDLTLNTPQEYELHVKNLNIAAETFKTKFEGPNATVLEIPNLIIKKYIINICGNCLVDIDKYNGPYPF